MCTLILIHGVYEDTPLLLAANRDERLDRPSEPPTLWGKHAIPTVAPRDLEAGGTWLGLNAAGVVAAVTNRAGEARQPNRRSRGELPLEALTEPRARIAVERVLEQEATEFNAFNLVLADREEAFILWSDGFRFAWDALEPGVHVYTEASFGARVPSREEAVKAALAGLVPGAGEPGTEVLLEVLRRHSSDPLAGTCIHVPGGHYGTRSSTFVRLGRQHERVEMLHADGPPCSAPYEDFGPLASRLQDRAPDVDGNWNPDD